jgi:hypothetical protein
MKVNTKIRIDVDFHKRESSNLFAEFHCNPAKEINVEYEDSDGDIYYSDEDEIEITFVRINKNNKKLNLTLTQDQCNEFIWALQKMKSIANDYRDKINKIKYVKQMETPA